MRRRSTATWARAIIGDPELTVAAPRGISACLSSLASAPGPDQVSRPSLRDVLALAAGLHAIAVCSGAAYDDAQPARKCVAEGFHGRENNVGKRKIAGNSCFPDEIAKLGRAPSREAGYAYRLPPIATYFAPRDGLVHT